MTKLSPDTLSNKVNSRLRFLYRQNKFLDIPLCRLLCNAMIQPFFVYACNAWYPNLNKNLKIRLQAAQNKCIKFCLKLGDRKKYYSIIEKINWLPIHERVNQCIISFIYKFHAEKAPDYLDEIFWTTMKIRLLQLFLCHPNHSFCIYLLFSIFSIFLYF